MLDSQSDDMEGKLVSLVKQQVDQIKILTAVSEALLSSDQVDFRLQVVQIREDSLRKLISALERLEGVVPLEISLELKSIFDTYLSSESADADMIAATFDRLLDGGHRLNFIQPDEILLLQELGVVMIVPIEATPDVEGNQTPANPATPAGTAIPAEAAPANPAIPVEAVPANPEIPSDTAGGEQAQNQPQA